METDYRKYFEGPQAGGLLETEQQKPALLPTLRPVEESERTVVPPPTAQPVAVSTEAEAEDPTAVTFPLNWLIRFLQYGAIAGGFGFVAHTAFTGDPEKDIWKILLGSAGVIAALCALPASIVLDRRGIHQVYCLGLYEYTIRRMAILSYQESTRAELRREGKLWFSWNRHNHDREDEHEHVVIVRSKYGKRYILHTNAHRGKYTFIEELEKRGVPAHGYEGWDEFMAQRGFPPAQG